MIEPIKVAGLDAFVRNLRTLDADAPKALRTSQNTAADLVVGWARPRVPKRSGRAASTIRAASTARATRVRSGGKRAPYMPWLDFGGRVGPGRRVVRDYRRQGRYVWAGLAANRDAIEAAVARALLDAAAAAGIEVD